MDATHDPALTSWVSSAQGHPDFPIQNLPFGIFHRVDDKDDPSLVRVGIAIGDSVLDLTACHDEGWFTGAADTAGAALAEPSLNALLAAGPETWRAVRQQASAVLASDSPAYRANRRIGDHILVPMAEAELLLPVAVGDYTDFYASVHHATNVGSMFRPDNPAAAQLQVDADRLPWPRLLDRAERHRRSVGRAASSRTPRLTRRSSARPARSTTRPKSATWSAAATRWARRCRSATRRRISSASAW